MRLIIFLSLLAFTMTAHAITYQTTAAFNQPSAFELASISQNLRAAAFRPLDQNGKGSIPFLGVDQVFVNHDQSIFLKLGLQVSKNLENKILPHSQGFMFHARSERQTPYALFFYKMNQVEVEKSLRAANIRFELGTSRAWMRVFIGREAQALTGAWCFPSDPKHASLGQDISASAMNEVIKSCAGSALKGVVEGAQDLVESSWYVLKNLLTDPEKLWSDVVQKYEQVQEVVTNIRAKMSEFVSGLKNLDPAIAAEIACSTASQVVTQSLLAGGFAKAGLLLTERMSALSKMTPALEALSRQQKLNPTANGPKDLTREVIACGM